MLATLMRLSLKRLGFTILGFFGLACALFVAALLINSHDEALAPEVRTLLTPRDAQIGRAHV